MRGCEVGVRKGLSGWAEIGRWLLRSSGMNPRSTASCQSDRTLAASFSGEPDTATGIHKRVKSSPGESLTHRVQHLEYFEIEAPRSLPRFYLIDQAQQPASHVQPEEQITVRSIYRTIVIDVTSVLTGRILCNGVT